jgi:hypothetical protein
MMFLPRVRRCSQLCGVLTLAIFVAAPLSSGQKFSVIIGPSVEMVPPRLVSIPRGKPGTVELNFRVARSFHINSNKPGSEFLIPTTLKLGPPTDLMIGRVTYPAGKELSFPFAPDEKLSVYSNDFRIAVQVRPLHTVVPGKYMIRGSLKYQACDNRACYPPKQLPVAFEVRIAKGAAQRIRRNRQSPHIHR